MTPKELEIIEQYKKNYGVQTDLQLIKALLIERSEFLKQKQRLDKFLENTFHHREKN